MSPNVQPVLPTWSLDGPAGSCNTQDDYIAVVIAGWFRVGPLLQPYDAGVEPAPDQSPQWGSWLGARMAATGFESNSDLARRTGVPDSVISRWRTSGTVPSIGQLRRLQQALQVSLLELLVAAGHLSADEAGITSFTEPVRVPRDTRAAIRNDPALEDDLKHLLEVQYDAMLSVARARRGQAAGSATPTPTAEEQASG
jgi:transcriptional regulator with XRE-family HTH domain